MFDPLRSLNPKKIAELSAVWPAPPFSEKLPRISRTFICSIWAVKLQIGCTGSGIQHQHRFLHEGKESRSGDTDPHPEISHTAASTPDCPGNKIAVPTVVCATAVANRIYQAGFPNVARRQRSREVETSRRSRIEHTTNILITISQLTPVEGFIPPNLARRL